MSSKRAQARRQCLGKEKHVSKAIAHKERMRLQSVRQGEVFDIYNCRVCGAWHVGHRQGMPFSEMTHAWGGGRNGRRP